MIIVRSFEYHVCEKTLNEKEEDLVLVVKLSPVDRLEVNVGYGFVRTHHAVTDSHQKVEASDDDENEDDDDGHGACGQDGLRAERTDHTETSLTGDDGRYDIGSPEETKESNKVVVRDEFEHRSVSASTRYSVSCVSYCETTRMIG